MDENFQIMLQAVLDKLKSIANIKENIKAIEPKLPKIKLRGTLNKTEVKKELNTKLKTINPKVKIDADTTQAEKKIRKINQQKSNPTVTPTVDNSQVVSGLKQAQKETKTLWERFTNGIFGINLIRMGIQEVTRAIRQAISNIKELDAIKTNIQMVAGTSDSGANAMMSGYNSMAKDLSSTTKEVAEAANEFLRMGESVASTNELIKSSQVLSKVGMIESAESASYLISSLKGYQVAAQDSMDVVSKLTSVDLEAAVSAGGLAEALSKCANIANNSGVAMDRLIGYTATVGETTQKSMSEVGNSFQALLSRMNNIKIGRFIDDETGESLSDTEAVLNKLGIQLRDTEDTYRSFDDVLDDIGSRWKDFTKVEQNAISVAIAGTRQRENFEALMNNWGNALKYAETAANSAGSALDRYGVYQDSIQAKTNELTVAMESLSTSVISEELYSGIIEATTGIVEFIDKTNLLKGTLAGLVAMGISKTIASIGAGFITVAKSTAQFTAAMALFDNGRSIANLQSIGVACKGLSDQQLKLVLSTKGLNKQQRLAILEGMGLEAQERQQTLTTLGFSAAEDKATISTFSLKGALNSLKTVIATNPIGVLVAAVSVATTVFSVYKQHQEEVRQATEEAANAYKESASSIEDYASRYEELHKALIAAKGNEEQTYSIKKQLLELQTELNDKFGDEYGVINLVTEAYKDQTEAIKALNKESAQTFLNENKEGIDKAEKEMTKDRHYNLSYTGLIGNTEKGEALKDIAEKYKEQGITLLDEYGDGTYLQFSIHLNADAQSAYETINAFENDLRDKAKELGDEHMFDDVLDVSSDSLNKAKETIENYGDTYKQALTAEIVSDDDKSKTYGEALKAVEAYNEAVLRSENPYDDQNVTQAKENLDAIKTSIQDNEAEWGKYSVLFDDVFGQADTRLFEFNEALKTDSGLKELANDLEGLNDTDLQALNENVGENNSFDKLKEAAAGYKVNVDELIAALVRLGYVQGEVQSTIADTTQSIPATISSSIQQIATQLEPQFSKFGEAYQEIFKLDDNGKEKFSLDSIDNSMLEELRQSFAEIESKVGVAFDTSKLEPFFAVLTNGSSTAEQVQQAFNDLATAYLYSTDTLEQLNAETADAIEKQLEEMGVQNAVEIVADALTAKTEELIVAKEYLAQTGKELASATEEERNAFILEQIEAGNCGEALALLQLKKLLVNQSTITTAADCQNILALAQAANIGIQQLQQLQTLMNMITQRDAAVQSGDSRAVSELNRAIREFSANVVNNLNLDDVKVDFGNIGGGASKAGKAGKKAGDAYVDAFEKELEKLQTLRDHGKITEKQYLDYLRKLYQRFFRDKKKYAEQYAKYEHEYLQGMKSLYQSALSGITSMLDKQISAYGDARDAAVESLEQQRDAAIEAKEAEKERYEQEIELINKQIATKEKAIQKVQDEIEAMRAANEEKKQAINLQQDEYILQRMLNQRSKQVYKDGQFVFETDTTGVREARQKVEDDKLEIEISKKEKEIKLMEKEIDLLNEKKNGINENIDLLDKQIDEIDEYYSKLISDTEKYWNDLIKGMEDYKSRWEELGEIEENAKLISTLKQLGIEVNDVLGMSEEAFAKFKDEYVGILADIYSGNDSMLSALSQTTGRSVDEMGSYLDATQGYIDSLSGIGDSLNPLAESIGNVDESMGTLSSTASEADENLSNAAGSVENVNSSLGETATTTGTVASNVSNLSSNLDAVNGSITAEHTAFESLKNIIDEVITAINKKIEAINAENTAVATATGTEIANFQLLINKILEVKEKLDEINTTVSTMDRQPIDNLANAFQLLYDKILPVSNLLGVGVEGEGAVSGIAGAIQSLNEISLEEGIIAQFTMLKEAIDSVTEAISGGGGESSEGEGSGSGSGSAGGKSGGKGSEGKGKGESGGGNSLTGAIKEMGETAKEVIGEPDAEGDGTVIGEFGSMETAVNDVRDAIGTEGSDGGNGGSGGETDDTLVGSIEYLGDKTEEEMGESGGDGIIGRFEEFESIIEEAANQVKSISEGLDEIDGKEVECTITINVKMNGDTTAFASGTVLGNMQIESATYNAKYGKAFASGTIGLPKAEKNALVSEYGQTEMTVLPDGKTIITDTPTMMDLPKDTVIYNEEETKKIMDNKVDVSGNAHADGTDDSIWITLADGTKVRPLQPGDKMYGLQQQFQAYLKSIDGNLEKLVPNSFYERNREMNKLAGQISYANNVVNNNRNVQQPVHNEIHITCPGVTSKEVAQQVGVEVGRIFNGMHLEAEQRSRMR